MKITNPYDLDHIKRTSEGITYETANALTSLPVGTALIVGEAVNYPFFFKVREKKIKPSKHEMKLEEAALKYEEEILSKGEDAKAFM
jgi:DNA helicase HerA-like ATPase